MSRRLVGASGWSYASWRPGFYPAGTPPEDFLHLAAGRLPAVENHEPIRQDKAAKKIARGPAL